MRVDSIVASLGDVSTPVEMTSTPVEMTSTPAEMTFPPQDTIRPPLKASPRANFSGGLRVEGLPVDAELSSLCQYLIIYMLSGWLDDVFGSLYMLQAHRP